MIPMEIYNIVRRYGEIIEQKDNEKENTREVKILYLDRLCYFKLHNGEIEKYYIEILDRRED